MYLALSDMCLLQGSHSLGYKNFQDISRTPKAFFQDRRTPAMLKYKDKQQLLCSLGQSPSRQRFFRIYRIVNF